MASSFDVFFSYSTRDHDVVERVARDLTGYGIRVFLDRWYLTPGQPWPQALEEKLAACNAVAVFIGAEGLGPWQQRERDLALDRQAQEPGFPVIPVLLVRADPALGFLKLNTWVDLSAGVSDPEALAILSAAIRREPPGPLGRQRSEAILAAVCPYRGLQVFREEDEPFFFGRTKFAETLTSAVLRQSLIAVVGASGSGKSSVVRAGLIPRLRRSAGNLVWDAVTLVPTDRPLISLSAALLPLLEPNASEVKQLAEVADLASHLQAGKIDLRDVVTRVLAKQPGTDRLLVFVDQWEEVYTLCGDPGMRQAFIGQLLNAAAADAIRVVLTIRGDFMGRVLENRELSDRLQDGLVTIGPMTRGELEETIVQPAAKTELSFEKGLPETILDDVGEEPGGLPLLEFLLEGLWRERRGNVLTHDAYVRLGRVSGAIAHRAEEVFELSLNEAERQAAHRLLIRMVRPGEGVEDTRRRAAMPEADAVADATIQKLAKERLLVTERDGGSGQVTVEVAHEALIRRWQRLRDWVDTDREFLRTRERIATQAQLWEEEKRSPERLLRPGRPLAEGEDLLAKRRADLEPMLVQYIEASKAAEQEEIVAARAKEEAERAAERRRSHVARLLAAAMTVLALLAAVGGGIAWWQREEARKAQATAESRNIVGVLVERRETTLDFSRWQDTTGTDIANKVKKSLVVSRNRFTIVRTGEQTTDFVHVVGTSSAIDPEFRCPCKKIVPPKTAPRAPHEWELVFDISDLPLEEERILEFSVLFWNAFQDSRQQWAGFRISHATELSIYSVEFPANKRPLPGTLSYYYFDRQEHPYENELRTKNLLDVTGRVAKLVWEVPYPRGDRSYRVKWAWTE